MRCNNYMIYTSAAVCIADSVVAAERNCVNHCLCSCFPQKSYLLVDSLVHRSAVIHPPKWMAMIQVLFQLLAAEGERLRPLLLASLGAIRTSLERNGSLLMKSIITHPTFKLLSIV